MLELMLMGGSRGGRLDMELLAADGCGSAAGCDCDCGRVVVICAGLLLDAVAVVVICAGLLLDAVAVVVVVVVAACCLASTLLLSLG